MAGERRSREMPELKFGMPEPKFEKPEPKFESPN